MRAVRLLPALLLVAAAAGCAQRARPYHFASPMLGASDVPPSWLGPGSGRGPGPDSEPPDARPTIAHGAPLANRPDAMPSEVRTGDTSIAAVRVASASAAEAVPGDAQAHGVAWSRLPAPHKVNPIVAAIASGAEIPILREATDLRALVGRRDKRDAFAVTFAWSRALGGALDPSITNGNELVDWASANERVSAPTDTVTAGDLLVFDHTDSDDQNDLVAIAIARDARGVIEMVYLAGGAVRRGFVDPHHAPKHRDAAGAIVNTFLRAGKRWPPKGTHYLAGELIAHVIHTR